MYAEYCAIRVDTIASAGNDWGGRKGGNNNGRRAKDEWWR
jgi:hypothetical protein